MGFFLGRQALVFRFLNVCYFMDIYLGMGGKALDPYIDGWENTLF